VPDEPISTAQTPPSWQETSTGAVPISRLRGFRCGRRNHEAALASHPPMAVWDRRAAFAPCRATERLRLGVCSQGAPTATARSSSEETLTPGATLGERWGSPYPSLPGGRCFGGVAEREAPGQHPVFFQPGFNLGWGGRALIKHDSMTGKGVQQFLPPRLSGQLRVATGRGQAVPFN